MNQNGVIAPCGMNCRLCYGYVRKKNRCNGCLIKNDNNQPDLWSRCSIVHCEHRLETASGFCYDCTRYPCRRLKDLDKRYTTKYGMSMLDNLLFIKEKGMEEFVKAEQEKWKCRNCGAGLSVHRDFCLQCGNKYR